MSPPVSITHFEITHLFEKLDFLKMFWFNFRDVSSVELLMNNHQGIKAEIDARNDSFTTCIELGKSLLARKHYASEEVECCFTLGSWDRCPGIKV